MSRRRMLFAVLILSAGALQAAPQASPPAQVPDTLAQRLLACASCHARIDARGNPVNDSYFPRITGKPDG